MAEVSRKQAAQFFVTNDSSLRGEVRRSWMKLRLVQVGDPIRARIGLCVRAGRPGKVYPAERANRRGGERNQLADVRAYLERQIVTEWQTSRPVVVGAAYAGGLMRLRSRRMDSTIAT